MVSFAEVVNLDKENIKPEELWNWIENICRNCPSDSSKGLYKNTVEMYSKSYKGKLQLLKLHYDSPAVAYLERAKALEILKRNQDRKGMRKDVNRYIRNCHTCQCSKASN